MCSSKKQNLTEEQKFEQKLFHSLKRYGYLFPETINDVDKFEELYGDTQIDIPEHLELEESSESLLDFDYSNNRAAFSNEKFSHFELPESKNSDIESSKKNSPIKKTKPKK